jgi:PAS domain S-box-containing protein
LKLSAAGRISGDRRATASDFSSAEGDLRTELRGLRERQKELERACSHYENLFDFAPVTYALLDAMGMVQAINLSGCRLLNCERSHIIGHSLIGFVAQEDRRELVEHLRRCRLGTGMVESEIRLLAKGGRLATCRLHSMRTAGGHGEAFPTVIVDQTERLALEEAGLTAERARDRAERNAAVASAATASRDRFLATVSHELRTPLTPALFAASRLCACGELPESAKKLARTIKRNIEFEARLIDDLLDLARIDRNMVALKLETVDVHDVVREAAAICRPTAEAKQVHLVLSLGAGRHHVAGDPNRLRQVFWNLLSNAVKFTASGGSIVVASVNLPDSAVRVSIGDTGAGMDPSTLEHLFAPFDRRPNPMDSRSGLGLGLAIARGIVAAHGGQIEASSDGRGRGSMFTVELVAVVPQPHAGHGRRAGDAAAASDVGRGQRVLIVEDDADSRDMVAHLLSHRGYIVEVASSLSGAVEKLGEHWDVVLTDVGLPDGSGLDLARRARELAHVPRRMIAYSGFGSSDDIRASLDAGFDAHVVKPIDMDSLLVMLGAPPSTS